MADFILHQSSNHMSLSTYALFDRTLSYKAKGLLVQMFSISKNDKWQNEWQWSVAGLCVLATDGKASVDSAIHELEEHGYLRREQMRTEDGRTNGYAYHVYEEPFTDFRKTDNPITENPPQYNNKKNKREKNNNNKEIQKEIPIEPEVIEDDGFETFWNLYDKKRGKENCMKVWSILSQRDRDAAIAYIPAYKQAQPDKQFRKDPLTFLHQKAWNDEIINSTQRQQNQTSGGSMLDVAQGADMIYNTGVLNI